MLLTGSTGGASQMLIPSGGALPMLIPFESVLFSMQYHLVQQAAFVTR